MKDKGLKNNHNFITEYLQVYSSKVKLRPLLEIGPDQPSQPTVVDY